MDIFINNDTLFEQSIITNCLIHLLITLFKEFSIKNKEKEGDILKLLKIINLIPIDCFSKFEKQQICEILENLGIFNNKINNDDVKILSRNALIEFLPIKSLIQDNFENSKYLFQSEHNNKIDNDKNNKNYNDLNDLGSKLFSTIWNHHILQQQDEISKNYIQGIFTMLTKDLKSKNIKEWLISYKLSSKVLNIGISNNKNLKLTIDDLRKQTFISALNVLDSITNNDELISYSWLLEEIVIIVDYDDLTLNEGKKYLSVISKYGEFLKNTTDDNNSHIQFSLYSLILKSFKGINQTKYALALYISLPKTITLNEQSQEAKKSLSNLISTISSEDYEIIIEYILNAIKLAKTNDSESKLVNYIDLLTITLKPMKKEWNINQSLITTILNDLRMSIYNIDVNIMNNLDIINSIVELLTIIIIEKSFSIDQYLIEMIISFINHLINKLSSFTTNIEKEILKIESIFILITKLLSQIILFQRYRLNGRHHLIIGIFTSLLECFAFKKQQQRVTTLTFKQRNNNNNNNDSLMIDKLSFDLEINDNNDIIKPISNSIPCVMAYNRLLDNLCNPSQTLYKDKSITTINHKNNEKDKIVPLNSTVTKIKNLLRKHISILLLNYVWISLYFDLNVNVREQLNIGFYSVWDVLASEDLKIVNAMLDQNGKSYFHVLHNDYKENGKWKEE